jgi:YfiH family protein
VSLVAPDASLLADEALPAGWHRPRFTSSRVHALMTSRQGGFSQAPFDSFNLRPGLGDDEVAVAANRRCLAGHLARDLGWLPELLQQVHGVTCLDLADLPLRTGEAALLQIGPAADAALGRSPGRVCEIQVADCLPVLFADRAGRAVAAAHAGWRGLAGGVIEQTLAALQHRAGVAAAEVEVWLGPCIGPTAFEVGEDVRLAFGAVDEATFRPRDGLAPTTPPKWWADLPALARRRLARLGVNSVSGNDGSAAWCTVRNLDYYSYRRDQGRTGRQAAYIWLS